MYGDYSIRVLLIILWKDPVVIIFACPVSIYLEFSVLQTNSQIIVHGTVNLEVHGSVPTQRSDDIS